MIWWKTPWSVLSIVKRDEEEWLQKNETRRRLALSRLDRELLFAGEHPFRFSFSIFLLQVALLYLAAKVPQEWLTPIWMVDGWKTAEQLTYFTTVWTIQATMAALVYPIVIAFVAVFLQRRPAAQAFVHLYMLDSGALAAGLSSLILVVVMTIQYLLIGTWGTNSLPAWAALDTAWFLMNSAMTTFFLFRTVDFLRPEVQKNVVQRYAVNVALPRDVRRLYPCRVLAAAQPKGWLPYPDPGEDNAPRGPRMHIGHYSLSDGDDQGALHVSGPSRLIDVRLWLLRAAVSGWYAKALSFDIPKDNEIGMRGRSGPLLVLPVTIGSVIDTKLTLAKVEGGPSLSRIQLWLLRKAFVLTPVSRERYGIKVEALVGELASDAQSAASRGDDNAFERAYDDLVQMHELLLAACVDENDDGTSGSWSLLSDIEHYFGRNLHEVWAQSYRQIFEAAIQNMANNTRPLQRLCHLVFHLQGGALNNSPAEIHESLLEQPGLMMYLLGGWWAHRVEEQGVMDHSFRKMVKLRPPLNRVYEEVMTSFVSGWENAWPGRIRRRDRMEAHSWNEYPRRMRLNVKHIDETALMLLSAVDRGDHSAAEWLADVLVKWWDQIDFDQEPFQLYGKTAFITLEHVSLDWSQVKALFAIEIQEHFAHEESVAHLQRAVYFAALRNYWTDIRLLVIEMLLAWMLDDVQPPTDDSLAAAIVIGLLNGHQWRGGGRVVQSLAQINSGTYLVAKARQFAATPSYRAGYSSRLDHFVERAKRMDRPNMVSSRVYSLRGADDIASLQKSQLALFALLSSEAWEVPRGLMRQIGIWINNPDQSRSIEILLHQINDWVTSLELMSQSELEIIRPIKEATRAGTSIEVAFDYAQAGLARIHGEIELERQRAIADQDVDPARLLEIGRFASSKAFSPTTGAFPMPLLAVSELNTDLEDFVLILNRVRKGELTRVELDQRVSNEEEYFSATLVQQVGAVIFWDIMDSCAKRELACSDAESYWLGLKTEAEKIAQNGEQPILLVNNAMQPEWVRDWQHPGFGVKYQRPADLSVQRRQSRIDEYVCNFNEIEVYVAPVEPGASVIMSKKVFKTVSFRKYEDGNFVNVTSVEIEDSPNLVNLRLKFSRRLDVERGEVVSLKFSESP